MSRADPVVRGPDPVVRGPDPVVRGPDPVVRGLGPYLLTAVAVLRTLIQRLYVEGASS